LLKLHRVPAVVQRIEDAHTLARVPVATRQDKRRLAAMRRQCRTHGEAAGSLVGSIMGFVREPVREVRRYHEEYLAATTFDVDAVRQEHIEFSRLMLQLLLFGVAEKLEHNIFLLEEADSKRTVVVGLDNDRANWRLKRVPAATPACTRTVHRRRFRCSLEGYDRSKEARSIGIIESYLCTACLFPADVGGYDDRGGRAAGRRRFASARQHVSRTRALAPLLVFRVSRLLALSRSTDVRLSSLLASNVPRPAQTLASASVRARGDRVSLA